MKAKTIADLGSEISHAFTVVCKGEKKYLATLSIKEKTYNDFLEHLKSTTLNVQMTDVLEDDKPRVNMLRYGPYAMVVEFTDLPYLHFELK